MSIFSYNVLRPHIALTDHLVFGLVLVVFGSVKRLNAAAVIWV